MSIVSLVIAPTLATIYGKAGSKEITKHEMIKEISISKTDSNNNMTVSVTAGKEAINAATDKLIDALATDNLLKKENYTLSVKKGIVSIDGTELKQETAAKYKTLIDALGGADLELKNSQK